MGKLDLHNIISNLNELEKIHWVEIGVRFGYNAKFVLSNYNIEKIYLIDPYVELPYLTEIFSKEQVDEYKATAKKLLTEFKDKCVWLEDFSENVHENVPNESIDVLYIDGNHSKESVLLDLENYIPKVKEGGLIIGDDFNEQGVEEAIREYGKKHDVDFNISNVKNSTSKFWFKNENRSLHSR